MAQSENHCSDNFTLNVGPQGQQGVQGQTGAKGAKGPKGAKGAKGAAGKNKIDISFQNNNTGYVSITSTAYTPIGYFIYGGTGTFTPTNLTIGLSILIVTGTITVSFELMNITGTTSTIFATLTATETNQTNHKFSLISTSTFSNLPAIGTIVQVSAKISQHNEGKSEANIYALEVR